MAEAMIGVAAGAWRDSGYFVRRRGLRVVFGEVDAASIRRWLS